MCHACSMTIVKLMREWPIFGSKSKKSIQNKQKKTTQPLWIPSKLGQLCDYIFSGFFFRFCFDWKQWETCAKSQIKIYTDCQPCTARKLPTVPKVLVVIHFFWTSRKVSPEIHKQFFFFFFRFMIDIVMLPRSLYMAYLRKRMTAAVPTTHCVQ